MNLRQPSMPVIYLADLKKRINWVKAGKWFTIVLLLVAAVMVVSYARSVDWNAVWTALRSYSRQEILVAAALTLTSFATYGTFDLFGRHYTGYQLPTLRVMLITAISYAFNLTLGTIVGAAGIRLRLYQHIGVKATDVARIIAISVAINWLGYAAVAGTLFVSGIVSLPQAWDVSPTTLPVIGWILLAIVVAYLVATIFWGDAKLQIRGREACLPKTPTALLQLIVGGANWMIMGGVMYYLMQERASYQMALAVVMVSSVAGIISRIPGGIGVLEAVAIAVLAPQLGEGRVLAGVLAYRAIYYLVPLTLAATGLVTLEALRRKTAASAS